MSKEKFASSVFSDFSGVKELYRSNAGSVYVGVFKYDSKKYVLKERKLPELGRRKDIMNEVKLLLQLEHINVVRCEGWFRDESRDALFIVLEYCDGGDLHSLIEKRRNTRRSASVDVPYFEERQIWYIFRQLCSGLEHIHENGIVHRDLKALNVMCSHSKSGSLVFKIGDLGVSRQVSEDTIMLKTLYGTPLYMSPELIENKPYNEKTDIWSLGVILYEMAALVPPFNANTILDLAQSVLKGKYEAIPKIYSNSLGRCIHWLLNLDYKKRPNIAQLLDFVDSKQTPGYSGQDFGKDGGLTPLAAGLKAAQDLAAARINAKNAGAGGNRDDGATSPSKKKKSLIVPNEDAVSSPERAEDRSSGQIAPTTDARQSKMSGAKSAVPAPTPPVFILPGSDTEAEEDGNKRNSDEASLDNSDIEQDSLGGNEKFAGQKKKSSVPFSQMQQHANRAELRSVSEKDQNDPRRRSSFGAKSSAQPPPSSSVLGTVERSKSRGEILNGEARNPLGRNALFLAEPGGARIETPPRKERAPRQFSGKVKEEVSEKDGINGDRSRHVRIATPGADQSGGCKAIGAERGGEGSGGKDVVAVDVQRLHVLLRRELVQLRKLRRMREFLAGGPTGRGSSGSEDDGGSATNVAQRSNEQPLALCEEKVKRLERAMDSGGLIESALADRYKLPVATAIAVDNAANGASAASNEHKELPPYLQKDAPSSSSSDRRRDKQYLNTADVPARSTILREYRSGRDPTNQLDSPRRKSPYHAPDEPVHIDNQELRYRVIPVSGNQYRQEPHKHQPQRQNKQHQQQREREISSPLPPSIQRFSEELQEIVVPHSSDDKERGKVDLLQHRRAHHELEYAPFQQHNHVRHGHHPPIVQADNGDGSGAGMALFVKNDFSSHPETAKSCVPAARHPQQHAVGSGGAAAVAINSNRQEYHQPQQDISLHGVPEQQKPRPKSAYARTRNPSEDRGINHPESPDGRPKSGKLSAGLDIFDRFGAGERRQTPAEQAGVAGVLSSSTTVPKKESRHPRPVQANNFKVAHAISRSPSPTQPIRAPLGEGSQVEAGVRNAERRSVSRGAARATAGEMGEGVIAGWSESAMADKYGKAAKNYRKKGSLNDFYTNGNAGGADCSCGKIVNSRAVTPMKHGKSAKHHGDGMHSLLHYPAEGSSSTENERTDASPIRSRKAALADLDRQQALERERLQDEQYRSEVRSVRQASAKLRQNGKEGSKERSKSKGKDDSSSPARIKRDKVAVSAKIGSSDGDIAFKTRGKSRYGAARSEVPVTVGRTVLAGGDVAAGVVSGGSRGAQTSKSMRDVFSQQDAEDASSASRSEEERDEGAQEREGRVPGADGGNRVHSASSGRARRRRHKQQQEENEGASGSETEDEEEGGEIPLARAQQQQERRGERGERGAAGQSKSKNVDKKSYRRRLTQALFDPGAGSYDIISGQAEA